MIADCIVFGAGERVVGKKGRQDSDASVFRPKSFEGVAFCRIGVNQGQHSSLNLTSEHSAISRFVTSTHSTNTFQLQSKSTLEISSACCAAHFCPNEFRLLTCSAIHATCSCPPQACGFVAVASTGWLCRNCSQRS